MSHPPPPEFEKFVDTSILYRELEDTVGRLRLSVFIAALGPISIGIFKAMQLLPMIRPVALAVLALPVLALILLVVNFLRSPVRARTSKQAVRAIVFTILLSVATYVLSTYFSLLKVK